MFLSWTVIAILGIIDRIKTLIKLKFAYRPQYEFLTLGGIVLIFIIISFTQFKLPHYLNIAIPLFSILTAAYLHDLKQLFKELNQIGFDWDRQYTKADFRIARLQAKFLDLATRKKVLGKMHLVHIY